MAPMIKVRIVRDGVESVIFCESFSVETASIDEVRQNEDEWIYRLADSHMKATGVSVATLAAIAGVERTTLSRGLAAWRRGEKRRRYNKDWERKFQFLRGVVR